jgi:hypothetical protein
VLQGLELLVTVLLARNRQPPPTVAAGVPHDELAAELITLPSGLLAMVCEAIVKLKVRRGAACACVCLGCVGHRRGADELPGRVHSASQSRVGAVLTSRASPTMAECWQYCESYRTLQVSDVVTTRRDSQRTGPLRRSSRQSTLRAGGSS